MDLTADDQPVAPHTRTEYPRGAEVHCAKLTEADVRAIRARHAAGNVTQAELAREYGLSQPAISMLLARRTWAHVL